MVARRRLLRSRHRVPRAAKLVRDLRTRLREGKNLVQIPHLSAEPADGPEQLLGRHRTGRIETSECVVEDRGPERTIQEGLATAAGRVLQQAFLPDQAKFADEDMIVGQPEDRTDRGVEPDPRNWRCIRLEFGRSVPKACRASHVGWQVRLHHRGVASITIPQTMGSNSLYIHRRQASSNCAGCSASSSIQTLMQGRGTRKTPTH